MKMTTLTANSRQKKKSFLTAVQELELATKGVQSYSKDIQAVETLQLDINALKAQLEKKDRDLLEERNRATSEKDKQTELSVHFEERSAEWVSQREELKLELEKCRAASKESREKHNTDLQKQIRALQEQNDQKAHEIDKKRTTITGLESRLMSSSNALKNLKSKIGWQEIGSNL
jgi:chromosome segregation ATPase